ncbi:MAG: dehydrogenase [Alphaproteobacteria bacterium]|nr:dehydrogenase [Alphaproteobacteria bacterium]
MLIRARAPLRLGLAGGGTDLSPYCDIYGGHVLNATIDKYAYTVLTPRSDGIVRFDATDIIEEVEFKADGDIPLEDPLGLHRAVYRRVVQDFNGGVPLPCTLSTFCEAPPGSGLGSSSTMVVSMLKAFVELLSLPLGDYDIARLAFEIERLDFGLHGGRQDQYAATFGGVNYMEFYADERVIVNPLRIKNWILAELESSIVLFFTGRSRSSAAIINEQTANVEQKDSKSIEAMHELKSDALHMKEAVLKGDLVRFGEFMRKSWDAKKRTAHSVSNDHIDSAYMSAMAAGAHAGKVSGAGGGGFMTFLTDPSRRMDVIRALNKQEGEVMGCHFTKRGTEGWRIN